MEKLKTTIRKLFEIIKNPVMRILPGQLAFYLVLSIAPMITLIGSIASLLSISIDSIVDFITEVLPLEVTEILLPFISGQGLNMNVVIFMITGFVLASNGPHSIIIASNALYKVKNKNYIYSRIKAFFMTILLVNLFFISLVVVGFGNTILSWFLEWNLFSFITKEIYWIFVLLKWPIAFIVVFYVIKVLYTMAPDKKIPSKYMNRGAFFVTSTFTLVTAIYSYYVSNFANYNLFYGGLSNIIIIMIWIYIISYILVLGIAINATYYEEVVETTSHKELKTSNTN